MRRAAAAMVALGGASAQTTSCTWSSAGSDFDLSAMTFGQASYNVMDVRDPSTSYVFNVCTDVPSPDPDPNGKCTGGNRPRNVNPATAWQLQKTSGAVSSCYRLGDTAASGWNYSVADAAYPSRGLVLTYTGGDSVWCPGYGAAQQKRSFSIEVACSLTAVTGPTQYTSASVRELNTCDYRVTLPSIAGCPLQCLTGGSLCNGNGVCGYNLDAGRSQCYCYTNFGGAKCDSYSPPSSSLGAEGVILIIVCIVLAAVLGLVGFMLIKLRRLQVNPAAYDELQGRFNELGQLA